MSRIAVVADLLPPQGSGGVASAHYNLIKAFRRGGAEVGAFTYADSRPGPGEPGVVRKRFPNLLRKAVKKAAQLALEVHGAVVTKKYPIGRVEEAAYALLGSLNGLRLLPSILRFRPDVVVVPDRGAVAAFWPSFLKKKCVVVAHANPLRFIGQPMLGPASETDLRLASWFEQKMYRNCAGVVCPSHYMEKFFRGSYASSARVAVIPNLLDEGLVASAVARPFHRRQKPGSLAVSIPAASNHNKGRQFTFEIVRRLALSQKGEVFFYLSGDIDEEIAACLKQAPTNARVYAPGPLSYETNLAYLRSCQLCVSPTMIENFGMALLEAQVCGIPVVSFDVGGNRDVVADGLTGRLVPFLDVEALIKASAELLSKPALRRKMALAARRRSLGLFSSDQTTRRYMEFFGSLR